MQPSMTTQGASSPRQPRYSHLRAGSDNCQKFLPLIRRQLFVPFPTGGIVVGSCVNNCVGDIVVWQVRIVCTSIKRKLKDARPRNLERIAKRSKRPA